MDSVYSRLQSQFKGRIRFVIVNWEDKDTKNLTSEYGVCEPPASIVLDARGNVVMKSEGVRSVNEMAGVLKSALDSKRSNGNTDGGKR